MHYSRTVDIILRAGLAFSLLYPPVNAAIDPASWIGYFPQFTRGIIDDQLLLHLFGVVEVGLAFWILSGWKIWLPALATAGLLVGIVVFNIPQFQVLFRDVPIAALALALALIHYPRHTSGTGS
ncbi:MAG: hypothetical protein U1C66_00995 [Patescibacteria group bacterium]|nr:hypothetical protein [Patescibacteria group bacterium]